MIVIERARLGMLVRYVGRPLALLFALDVVIASLYVFAHWKWLALPDIPLSILGGVIGVIAGFRNASAYARWWEARIIWGSVVNYSRSFAREVLSMIAAPSDSYTVQRGLCEAQHDLITLQIAWVHALRNHLRRVSPWPELAGILPESEISLLRGHDNVPVAIQLQIAFRLARCYRRGWIDDMRWVNLDRTLSSLCESQGASERIKTTPLPRLYDVFIRVFVEIYCLLLPLGMVASLGLWTPFGSTVVGFMFLALDQIGRDLEAPFENLPHDISLTAISRTIEINLKQMLGGEKVPEPLAPVNGVLW